MRSRAALAIAVLVACGAGCGSSDDGNDERSSSASAPGSGSSHQGRPGKPLHGGRRQVERNGATIVLPPPPKVERTEPGPRCLPGLTAKNIAGEKAEFHYSLSDCRPQWLYVSAGINDSDFRRYAVQRRIKNPSGTVTIALPDTLRDADVATARVVATDGRGSRVVRVRMTSG